MLVTGVAQGALAAGKVVCGPLRRMGVRPDFTCFQGETEGANIRKGVQAEIEAANGRFVAVAAPSSDVAGLLGELVSACGEVVHMSECRAIGRNNGAWNDGDGSPRGRGAYRSDHRRQPTAG
jgi:hypothetical protein